MNAVIYYSNTNESFKIASYISELMKYDLVDINKSTNDIYHNVVLVFPVYSQNIPFIVKEFLNKIQVKSLVIVATYGKMSYGNVLYEIKHQYKHRIVCAIYVPTKHSYLENDSTFTNYEKLNTIKTHIINNQEVIIPKSHKNIFASFFPNLRSRMAVKIIKTTLCNDCGICSAHCKNIINGKTTNSCIRCLKCVNICPNIALKVKYSLFLRLYLKKKKVNDLIIY